MLTPDAVKGRIMSQLIQQDPVEMLDECRCGNSFLMTKATGHRLTEVDINQLVAYIAHLEQELKEKK